MHRVFFRLPAKRNPYQAGKAPSIRVRRVSKVGAGARSAYLGFRFAAGNGGYSDSSGYSARSFSPAAASVASFLAKQKRITR